MADPGALAQWAQMSYAERLWVIGQQYPDGIPQDVLNNLVTEEIKRQYGYLSTYIDHPEVGPILKEAAANGWTQERLQAALFNTGWWKSMSQSQREWDLLRTSDPASAQQKITTMVSQIRTIATQAGIANQFDDATYAQLADQFISHGFDQTQIQQAVIAHASYQPGAAPPVGTIGMTMDQVKARADDFGLIMGDQAAFQWAQQTAAGTVNAEAIDVMLREQAKARYSWLAPDLDRGATVKQIFDPIIQQTAQLLEKSPSQISLADPTFSKIVDYTDPSGVRRSMTGAEAADYVRSLDEWGTTRNARQGAAGLGEQILNTFGKVAS